MLTLRKEVMQAFDEAARQRFIDEMATHSQAFAPRLCNITPETRLRSALDEALDRASDYGFTLRGPVRLYIELMLMRGSAFHNDPLHADIGELLRDERDQMWRAEKIHRLTKDYIVDVVGQDSRNLRGFFDKLHALSMAPLPVGDHSFDTDTPRLLATLYPQKAAHVGQGALAALVASGAQTAERYQLPLRGRVLLTLLMFVFGHGCCHDPLYPWIASTLQDDRRQTGEDRTARLEQKAKTWLKFALRP